MRALAASVLAAALAWPCAAAGQALPAPVARESPPLLVQGEGTMRFFGLKVYDIRLWTPMKVFSHSEPFALELIYDMSLKGRDIAEKSIELMREQGHGDEAKLKRWGEAMARVFPDIRKGDTLIGVSVPGKEARFYTRDKFIAAVTDPEFSRAFFDIWLSEKTTAPGVRQKLLGGQGQ